MKANGYSSQECWCGNFIRFQNVPAPLADCSMKCSGNSSQVCGAGDRLTMFGFGSSNGTAGTEPAPVVPVVPVGPTVPAGPAPTQAGKLPANWTYAGCYVDGVNGRILPIQLPDSANLTVTNCITECASRNYSISGLQYASQCFCGKALYGGAALTDESQCSMKCSGNSYELCGNGNRMSTYTTGNITAYSPPTTVNTTGNWTYVGCWTDNLNGKLAMRWQLPDNYNNSAENCLGQCQKYGYMTGGMQFGRECSCSVRSHSFSYTIDADESRIGRQSLPLDPPRDRIRNATCPALATELNYAERDLDSQCTTGPAPHCTNSEHLKVRIEVNTR